MKKAIEKFAEQFSWRPVLENAASLKKCDKFIVVGMGGSNLSAGLLRVYDPAVDIVVHRNYGLPYLNDKESKERLVICSSYSGNTEEVIDAFKMAVKKKLSLAVISTGGKLLELARGGSVPYVQMPDWNLEPRMAVGLNFMALLKVMGREKELKEATKLSLVLRPTNLEKRGEDLAKKLKDRVPVIYSSLENKGIVYNWKIKFNETSKIPAFFNVLPELNHNEMIGFGSNESNNNLSGRFSFIILRDSEDNERIIKRMNILQNLFGKRGLPVEVIELTGKNRLHKIFNSLILADWTSFYLAAEYGSDPGDTSMIEEFKRLIS